MRNFIFSTILVFSFSILACGQQTKTSFYLEDNFDNRISIPKEILEVLSKDEVIERCFDSKAQLQDLSQWLEATKINLNDDDVADILVKGIDDTGERTSNCINGNAVSFWAFVSQKDKYNLVLYDYTLSLDIEKNKSESFFNISTTRCTANTCYKTFYVYDGKKYVEDREESKPNN